MKSRIAVLAAALALPFSAVACSDDEPANAVPDDVWAVVEDYTQAWNDYDGEAFRSVVTEDYHFVTGGMETGVEAQANLISTALSSQDWAAETVGDPIVAGDGPYYVAITNQLTSASSPDGVEGMSTVTVVDDNGALKVSEHVYEGMVP